jgi:hypothetical protein
VRIQLKQIDPLLDIKWVPNAVFDRDSGSFQGRYALMCKWPETDKRWALHRSGELGDPLDVLGWFVEPDESGGLHDGTRLPVDPDMLMDRVVEWLGKMDNQRGTWKDRMKKAIEHNRRLEKSRLDDVNDEAVEAFKYYHSKMAGNPIISGIGPGTLRQAEKTHE